MGKKRDKLLDSTSFISHKYYNKKSGVLCPPSLYHKFKYPTYAFDWQRFYLNQNSPTRYKHPIKNDVWLNSIPRDVDNHFRYCTIDSSQVRIGENTDNLFKIDDLGWFTKI